MWNNKRDQALDGRSQDCIDQLADELLSALAVSDAEIDAAAESPFLYRRIRVRIEQEERRRTGESNPWLALFQTAQRAVPAFVLAAIIASVASWYLHTQLAPGQPLISQTQIMGDVAGLTSEEAVAAVAGFDDNRAEEIGESQ